MISLIELKWIFKMMDYYEVNPIQAKDNDANANAIDINGFDYKFYMYSMLIQITYDMTWNGL